ncbi:thiamine pyrophosphate-dependent dehydrogenase E1 component subunit alpha [Candidatus Parcubacteria bacterium]|nr:MAG: thiamine pyrophosphate-dependent dehydrogenase E1 component subunit alpha [Candidatus Parcubacteria bacterium]
MKSISHETLYRSLYRIRRVEEEIARVYPTDKIQSPVHLSIGQEAVSVGVAEALKPQDAVFGTYRSHALYLAKGGDLKKMIAELYGKHTGSNKGKGGSMHLIDVRVGVMGASAIVGTTIPQAVGFALAIRYRGDRDRIAVSFFGDGGVDEGVWHESMNFAALRKLPVIFICENNFYAIHSHERARHARANIVERARAYGMPAERIEGNDVLKIYERARRARQAITAGKSGPIFFECMTYRWRQHVGPGDDYDQGYRTKKELEPWVKNDQLPRIGNLLAPKKRAAIERAVEREIKAAFAYAEKSPFPKVEELFTDVFA